VEATTIRIGMVCLGEQGPNAPAAFLCCGKNHPLIEALGEDGEYSVADELSAADVEAFVDHWHKEADSMGVCAREGRLPEPAGLVYGYRA
jgi:hypothetical protein